MFCNALERGFYNKTRAFLTFLALQHPAQELKSMFPGNLRTFRCAHIEWSHIECSHRVVTHRVLTYRVLPYSVHIDWSHIECSHRVVTHRVLT